MKNSILKMACIMLIVMFIIAMMPSFVKAAEDELEVLILEKAGGEKIIYIKSLSTLDTDFKYAFSNEKEDVSAVYTTCQTDSNGEKVAYLESEKTYNYMFITDGTDTWTVDLSSVETITEDELAEIEALTTKIGVDTTQTTTYADIAEDGTAITTTIGKIVITEDGEYQYQIIEILDTNSTVTTLNETAVELYEQLSALDSAETMYDKLSIYITIRDDYAKLLEDATWTDVEDLEILQPEEAETGEKYIVLIQKIEDGKVTIQDIQFMTCDRQDDEGVDETNTQVTNTVEKKTALPVTGEVLAIYIALAVIILAIVIVAVRMKYLKGKENGKH